jgi:hypothetical protein
MFNQLSPDEVVTAIGTTLRQAARSEGQASAFDRDQLMSAYSATRHLSVELATYAPELSKFTTAVSDQIRSSGAPDANGELGALADRIEQSSDPGAVGAALCELFELLRQTPSEPTRALRAQLHRQLRSLTDREVDLLADALA